MTPLAVISDVHGNRWALEAVLEDIERNGVARIVNLGDTVYGPLDPAGTAGLLMSLDLPTVRGNEDRLIADGEAAASETLSFVRRELSSAQLDWLRGLPESRIEEGAYLCHGVPGSDTTYLLRDVGPAGARLRPAEEVEALIASVEEPLVLCGHDHLPLTLEPAGRRLVVNPGSVGLPAYADDEPFPHVMELGSPHACYAIVRRSTRGWRVTHCEVPYDRSAAVGAALRNGRPDWARWLDTGRAGG